MYTSRVAVSRVNWAPTYIPGQLISLKNQIPGKQTAIFFISEILMDSIVKYHLCIQK